MTGDTYQAYCELMEGVRSAIVELRDCGRNDWCEAAIKILLASRAKAFSVLKWAYCPNCERPLRLSEFRIAAKTLNCASCGQGPENEDESADG